jgi:hypothetical protein
MELGSGADSHGCLLFAQEFHAVASSGLPYASVEQRRSGRAAIAALQKKQ